MACAALEAQSQGWKAVLSKLRGKRCPWLVVERAWDETVMDLSFSCSNAATLLKWSLERVARKVKWKPDAAKKIAEVVAATNCGPCQVMVQRNACRWGMDTSAVGELFVPPMVLERNTATCISEALDSVPEFSRTQLAGLAETQCCWVALIYVKDGLRANDKVAAEHQASLPPNVFLFSVTCLVHTVYTPCKFVLTYWGHLSPLYSAGSLINMRDALTRLSRAVVVLLQKKLRFVLCDGGGRAPDNTSAFRQLVLEITLLREPLLTRAAVNVGLPQPPLPPRSWQHLQSVADGLSSMLNGDWMSISPTHFCSPQCGCTSKEEAIQKIAGLLSKALLARPPRKLALSKWSTVQDNVQWWSLGFLCHQLITQAWIQEFGPDVLGEHAAASEEDESGIEDDWHKVLGRRKLKSVRYFSEKENLLSMSLLACITVPVDSLVQFLATQDVSDACREQHFSPAILRCIADDGPVLSAVRQTVWNLKPGAPLVRMLTALCSSEVRSQQHNFWTHWGAQATALVLYISGGLFLKACLPLMQYPYALFNVLDTDPLVARNAADHFFQINTCCLDVCSKRVRNITRTPAVLLSKEFREFLQSVAEMMVLANVQVERDHAHNLQISCSSSGRQRGRRITVDRLRCQSFLDNWRREHMQRNGQDPNLCTASTLKSYGVLTRRVRKQLGKRRGVGGNPKMFYVNQSMSKTRGMTHQNRKLLMAQHLREFDTFSTEVKEYWARRWRSSGKTQSTSGGRAPPDTFRSVWAAGTRRWPLSPDWLMTYAKGRGLTVLGRELRESFSAHALGKAEANKPATESRRKKGDGSDGKPCSELHPGICAKESGCNLRNILRCTRGLHRMLLSQGQKQTRQFLGTCWRLAVSSTDVDVFFVLAWLRYKPQCVVVCECCVLADPEQTSDGSLILEMVPCPKTGVKFLTGFSLVGELFKKAQAAHVDIKQVEARQLPGGPDHDKMGQLDCFRVLCAECEPICVYDSRPSAPPAAAQRKTDRDVFDDAAWTSEEINHVSKNVENVGETMSR